MNASYLKETREAYTVLLEKIVDASLRMGLELNLTQQSALAMLLEGSSYKEIAQDLNISHAYAVELTKNAVDELGLFLNRLGSLEKAKQDAEKKAERDKMYYLNRIQELHDEIENLKRKLKSEGTSLRYMSIHHLPISPILMSVLLRAGYNTLDDVAREDKEVLKALPGMTKDMLRAIDKFIEFSKNMQDMDSP